MKTALLVLPGLGDSRRGRRAIRAWAHTQSLELHLPRYRRRAGLDATVRALARYIDLHRLAEAERLCAFCYVVGGWALNRYLRDHALPNLTHVVYDRSPFQERLAETFVARFPRMARLRFGRLLREFAEAPYPALAPNDRKIGLVIENRATKLARRLVVERDIPVTPQHFGQPHDDAMHVLLDHAEMYRRFDVFGPELAHFFAHGEFTDAARRAPFERDPFLD